MERHTGGRGLRSGPGVWWGSGAENGRGTGDGEGNDEKNDKESGEESGEESDGVSRGDGGACLGNGLCGAPHGGHPGCYLHCATGCAPYLVSGGGYGGSR